MTRLRWISLLCVVVMLLSVICGAVSADGKTTATPETYKVSDAELSAFIDRVWADSDSVPVSETEALVTSLDAEQLDTLIGLIAVKTGIPAEELRKERQASLSKVPSGWPDGWEWHQTVPNQQGSLWSFFLSSYERDPYSTDDDWRFLFYPCDYYQNSDGLRWDANDSRVWLAIWTFTGLDNVSGYCYSWQNVWLILGDTTVNAAGGISEVVEHFRLWYP